MPGQSGTHSSEAAPPERLLLTPLASAFVPLLQQPLVVLFREEHHFGIRMGHFIDAALTVCPISQSNR